MSLRKILAALMMAAVLTGGGATAAPAPYPAPADERSEREAGLYEDATDAIDDENWEEALRLFTRVAEMKGTRADGAVFWSAYAMKKLGRKAEALKTIDGFKKAYKKSRWLDDAKALELELRQSRGESVAPENVGGDDDLKMIAINSLMHTDPEKAFPLLEKIVRNAGTSNKIRERALFVLSQSSSARSQALLAEVARGSANPELQEEAIKYLGISGSAHNRQVLADLYSSQLSRDMKKEILQAFMISGDKARVVTLARSEKDPDLRGEAIRMLGLMGGRAELSAMYTSDNTRETREAVIEALFLAGDTQRIGELAKSEKDPHLRMEAIQKLGLMGGTSATLASLYAGDSDVHVKEAVIEAYFLQGNARALIDIAKRETNKQLRKEAMEKLSLMNDDEALAYMLQILNE